MKFLVLLDVVDKVGLGVVTYKAFGGHEFDSESEAVAHANAFIHSINNRGGSAHHSFSGPIRLLNENKGPMGLLTITQVRK